jgi:hypothetical protein
LTKARPHGFGQFIAGHGFHSLYLVTTERDAPVKIGITDDPVRRLGDLQSANFALLRLHRFWWLPGQPISGRIERAFKDHFRSCNIRGEWFELPLPDAEVFVERAIRRLGTWGIQEAEMIDLMAQFERRRFSLPPDAPAPLRGVAHRQ